MNPSLQAQSAPSPALVFETLLAYQRSAALRSAIELDVFRAIGEGVQDTASLAKRCSASERGGVLYAFSDRAEDVQLNGGPQRSGPLVGQ